MKIYLASRYSRFPELQEYGKELEALGHKVTSRWIKGDHQINDAGLLDDSNMEAEALRIRYAVEDIDDLMEAECVISFTEEPRTSSTRGGRHVEFGIGYAVGKRLIVVGYRENIFHCLPDIEFYHSWEEALPRL